MFARIKKSGKNEYLQIVENRREGKKTIQRVVATIGRMDQLRDKGEIENHHPLPLPIFREGSSGPLRKSNADVRADGEEDRSCADL